MKRIALVVPEYRTDVSGGGGVATVADFLIDSFRSDPGWSVEVISPRMWHGAGESRRILHPSSWRRGVSTSQTTIDDLPVTYVGADWAEFEFMRYRPRRAIDRMAEQFDLMLTVSGTPAVCNILARVKTPIVAQVATMVDEERARLILTLPILRRTATKLNTWITARLDRRGIRVPDTIVVENERMAVLAATHGACNVELRSPGIDTTLFTPAPADPGGGVGYLLMVGRLDDPRKDLPTLLRAYSIARECFDVAQRLVLAGRYAPSAEDTQLLRKLKLEEHVDVRTGVSTAELVELYQRADLFVLSSAEEGLGMVLLEAMAAGLPVVSTATEGAKHVLGGAPVGDLVDFGPELERRLALAMSNLLSDPARRLVEGEAARSRAEELFSVQVAGRRFLEIANDVVARDRAKHGRGR